MSQSYYPEKSISKRIASKLSEEKRVAQGEEIDGQDDTQGLHDENQRQSAEELLQEALSGLEAHCSGACEETIRKIKEFFGEDDIDGDFPPEKGPNPAQRNQDTEYFG